MSSLAERVVIDRRFARSARIDADLGGSPPLAGYVLQASVERALRTMAASQAESGQGAFTWTGPYGGGKSSAALLVANLVGGAPEQRAIARGIAGKPLTELFASAFPERDTPWSIVAVTGSRSSLRESLADAAGATLKWSRALQEKARENDAALIKAFCDKSALARSNVLVVLDELGKMLEHEALTGGDAHLLQDLAERASRSDGRLVVIGILHQSFDQYADRADRSARREWAKVQGRFHDIPFLSAADETVALLGRAITVERRPKTAAVAAQAVAAAVSQRRPADVEHLGKLLEATWPLNPVTALLLGPVSRQRFAQNERSVFGFLSSSEPAAFQEFLHHATTKGETYNPDRLWDYLAANFGMALAAGADGGRFSLAFEAIERAGARGGAVHVAITKSAAMIEFFRNGSGLMLADDFIKCAVPVFDAATVEAALADLVEWAVLIKQPRLGGFALFAGSDFDLDEAIGRATAPLSGDDLQLIPDRVGIAAISAKRHYFETGTLRTFEILLAVAGADIPDDAIIERARSRPSRTSGIFLLLLGDGSLSAQQIDTRAKRIAQALGQAGVVAAVGSTPRPYHLRASAEELFAIDRVLRDHPQLEGDRIARREIAARQSSLIEALQLLLEDAIDSAKWRLAIDPGVAIQQRRALLATALANASFPSAPVIRSELLQRDRPSSTAMAARRDLCWAMVAHADQADLGIDGYPAERGLYLTLLKPLGLHRQTADSFSFMAPLDKGQGASLLPAWQLLDELGDQTLADIFATWRQPPFGMKLGVMPVIALAYLLANRDEVALYIDDLYQPAIDDLVVDKLLQKPGALRFRRIDRSMQETAFQSRLAERLGLAGDATALTVAQTLYQRFSKLPAYAKRTKVADASTLTIRDVVLKSNDPETLLFSALPSTGGETPPSADAVLRALENCEQLYPALLHSIRVALARTLGADVADFHGLSARALSIRDLTNDYAFEAFAMRAAAFDGEDGDIEGLASLLVHKPCAAWSDRDRDQALLELARYGRRFREAEALATVRDRRSTTEALALVVGVDPRTPPLLSSFELTDDEKLVAADLADDVLAALAAKGSTGHLRLAALARAVASLAGEMEAA